MNIERDVRSWLIIWSVIILMLLSACTPSPLRWDPSVVYEMTPVDANEIHSGRFGENARFHIELHDGAVFTFRLTSFPEIKGIEHVAGIDEVTKEVVILNRDEIKTAKFITMRPVDMGSDEQDSGDHDNNQGSSENLFWAMFIPIAVVSLPVIEAEQQAKSVQRERAMARIDVDDELQSLRRARAALKSGDPEKAYRQLESGLTSRYAEVRNKTRMFISDHPEVLEGARSSFTVRNLQLSIATHGAEARNLESKRLSIFQTVASEKDYQAARLAFENVFPEVD